MYDRILLPLDGSLFSEEVIPYAKGLAAPNNTPITLLRVVQKEADRAEADAYMAKLAAAQGTEHLSVVAEGDAADAILREAGRVTNTLVCMTSHGRSGVLESVLGSVALRVVRGSSLPVLVYHPHGSESGTSPMKIKQVVLPLDGTPLSEAMGPQAAELAKWLGAGLFVVEVMDPKAGESYAGSTSGQKQLESAYIRATARELGERYGVEANWDTLGGPNPADAIADFVSAQPGVILAMATRGRRGLQSALLGSVTAGSLRKARVPILMRVP